MSLQVFIDWSTYTCEVGIQQHYQDLDSYNQIFTQLIIREDNCHKKIILQWVGYLDPKSSLKLKKLVILTIGE